MTLLTIEFESVIIVIMYFYYAKEKLFMKTKALVIAAAAGAAALFGIHKSNEKKHKDICMIAHRGHSAKQPGMEMSEIMPSLAARY